MAKVEISSHDVAGYRICEKTISFSNKIVILRAVDAAGETLFEVTMFGAETMPKMLPWAED